jgi:hypothetical protein
MQRSRIGGFLAGKILRRCCRDHGNVGFVFYGLESFSCQKYHPQKALLDKPAVAPAAAIKRIIPAPIVTRSISEDQLLQPEAQARVDK